MAETRREASAGERNDLGKTRASSECGPSNMV
jgi:hypothetical protein